MGKKILIITVDALRYDCVSYNPDRPMLERSGVSSMVNTPAIDEIAYNSSVFTNCFSTNTYTTAAHASLFTGLYPPNHGLRPFFYKKLSDNCITLAEILRKNGFKTIFSGDFPELFEPFGLTRGFSRRFVRDDKGLLEMLSDSKDSDVFCFMHLFDVHEPYLYCECPPSENYNGDYYEFLKNTALSHNIALTETEPHKAFNALKKAVSPTGSVFLVPYIKGVNKFDGGRFKYLYDNLKEIGFFDKDSIYAVLSDHGEGRVSLENQDIFNHAGALFDEVIRIPLIFNSPGLKKNKYEGLASIADIFPTILNALKIGFPRAELDGIDLSENREFCYSELFYIKQYGDKSIELSGDSSNRPKAENLTDNFEYLLNQRAVRTNNKKYIFKHIDLNGIKEDYLAGKKTGDEEYVKWLYRSLLLRFADEEGLNSKLSRLKAKETTRLGLYNEFISSEERNNIKNYYYDLSGDPLEKKPVNFDMNFKEALNYEKYLGNLERNATVTGNIYTGGKAEKEFLDSKAGFSMEIIKEAFNRFGKDAGVGFTGGKDSTVLLYLVKKAFGGKIPFRVINIDTSADFKEIREFIDKIKILWDFDLIVRQNTEKLRIIKIAENKEECCLNLKTEPLKKLIAELKLNALLTGVRRDEDAARANETYFSARNDPGHFRVHPLLHFSEKDVWDLIKSENIPYCGLYNEGYRSLDCKPCTEKTEKGEGERSGRSKEKEALMERLRDLGYF